MDNWKKGDINFNIDYATWIFDDDVKLRGKATADNIAVGGSYATVYLSILGSEEEKEAGRAALQRAAGYIRNNIGKAVKIKHVPELTFKTDTALEYGMHIEKIIDDLHKGSDEQ